VIPAGAVATITDLDDPPADELHAAGVDVVMLYRDCGGLGPDPVRVEVSWRPGLVPGHEPPAPFWIRWNPRTGTFDRLPEESRS
jgi:hypothetical protein